MCHDRSVAAPGGAKHDGRGRFVTGAAVVAMAAGYFVAGEAGFALVRSRAVIPIWPATGLAGAGLVFFGRRAWPGVPVGAFLLDVRPMEPGAGPGAAAPPPSLPLVVA